MFGIGRRKTHSEHIKGELGESFDHFMQAATHAASGVGATVGPRVHAARDLVAPATDRLRHGASNGWESTVTALAPLAIAAAEGARQAGGVARKAKPKKPGLMRKRGSQMSRRRWPILAGLLATGAIVGAAGAVVRKRRMTQQWDEYDPGRGPGPMPNDATAMGGPSSGASSDDALRAATSTKAQHGTPMTASTDATADLTMPDAPTARMTGTKKQGDPLAVDVASNAGGGSRNSHT